MGERGNVFFADQVDGNELRGMYFYTHFGGEGLPFVVKAALERGKSRWSDSAYLARIVFCEFVEGDVRGETGYGLSTVLCDNEHTIVRINAMQERVSFHEEGSEANAADAGTASWSFEEFLAAPE